MNCYNACFVMILIKMILKIYQIKSHKKIADNKIICMLKMRTHCIDSTFSLDNLIKRLRRMVHKLEFSLPIQVN